MAMFKVDIAVGNPDGGDLRRAKAVVDAGADHSMLPAQLLGDLGLAPLDRMRFMLADGSIAEYGIGIARFKINGRERPRPVVFGPDDWYLLAASTLEIFNLRADSANGRLAPEEWLSLSSGCRPDFVMDDTAPIRPTAVAPREGYRIWLRYSDGVSGEVDLSHPAGACSQLGTTGRFSSRCGWPRAAG